MRLEVSFYIPPIHKGILQYYVISHHSMDGVNQQHDEVQGYVDQVHPKTLNAIELEEQRLNQRYFHLLNQLERTRHLIVKLEEKLKQQNDLENHPHIKQIVDELAKVDKYKETLINKTHQFKEALIQNKATIKDLRQQVYAKRLEVRDIVQESWKTQSQILHYSKLLNVQSVNSIDSNNLFLTAAEPHSQHQRLSLSTLPPIKLKKKSKSSLYSVLQSIQTPNQQQQMKEILEIYNQVDELRKRAHQRRIEIQKMSNKFNQIKNLANECMQLSVKHFKNRQKITNHNGYANSIYFDVSSIHKSENLIVKERKIQNILYDTLQHIMIDMIDSQQRGNESNGSTVADSIIRNQVSLDQFMQFTSDQILGLIVLQPRLLSELLSVFEIKAKQIGLLGGKLRIYQSQIEPI